MMGMKKPICKICGKEIQYRHQLVIALPAYNRYGLENMHVDCSKNVPDKMILYKNGFGKGFRRVLLSIMIFVIVLILILSVNNNGNLSYAIFSGLGAGIILIIIRYYFMMRTINSLN
ncbi:hypothetical protein H6503_05370 [Candidatus Woesearchaeota archaeon]|nr:hypothetical protein [Candidatus Woesearchaeota archaeon]